MAEIEAATRATPGAIGHYLHLDGPGLPLSRLYEAALAAQPALRAEDEAMRQHRARQRLQIIRGDEVAAANGCQRLTCSQPGQRPARADAQLHRRIGA